MNVLCVFVNLYIYVCVYIYIYIYIARQHFLC